MNWIMLSRIECVLVLISNLVLSSASQNCYKKIRISKETTNITEHTFDIPRPLNYCVLEIESEPGHLIDLNLYYIPYDPQTDIDCTKDYLHVGNNGDMIDHELMTSYKFCDELHKENIISRYNYLWVVLKTSSIPRKFNFDMRAKPKVQCRSREFQCSPIQCVSVDVICDGVIDCHNGRDEFCLKEYPDNSCFHCFDGTCINPTLPRYHVDWGKELWYLCDDFKHCPDGTDERKDICYRIDSRVASMMNCIPNGAKTDTSVMMWNTVRCNGKNDCLDGSDESSEECHKKEAGNGVYRPISVGIVVFFCLIVTVGSCCALKIHNKHVNQQRKIISHSDRTENTDGENPKESQSLKSKMCSIEEEFDTAIHDNHSQSSTSSQVSLNLYSEITAQDTPSIDLKKPNLFDSDEYENTTQYVDEYGIVNTDL